MQVTIGTGRRVTIPADLFITTNFTEGQRLNIEYIDGKLILSPIGTQEDTSTSNNITNNINRTTNEKKTDEIKLANTNNKPVRIINKVRIESNLTEGAFFSNRIYSPCGWVIRTKRKYINKFCDACKGVLLRDGYEDNGKCQYSTDTQICEIKTEKTLPKTEAKTKTEIKITPTTQKILNKPKINKEDVHDIAKEIQLNAEKLKQKLTKDVQLLEEEENKKLEKQRKFLQDISNYTIKPVKIKEGFKKCSKCGSFIDSGFVVNDKFYCKNCTILDFKKYYKEVNKIGGI